MCWRLFAKKKDSEIASIAEWSLFCWLSSARQPSALGKRRTAPDTKKKATKKSWRYWEVMWLKAWSETMLTNERYENTIFAIKHCHTKYTVCISNIKIPQFHCKNLAIKVVHQSSLKTPGKRAISSPPKTRRVENGFDHWDFAWFLSSQRNAWEEFASSQKEFLELRMFGVFQNPPEPPEAWKTGEPEVENSYDGKKTPKELGISLTICPEKKIVPRILSLLKCQTKWGTI